MKEDENKKCSKDSKERDHENTLVSRISVNGRRETYFKRWRRNGKKQRKSNGHRKFSAHVAMF